MIWNGIDPIEERRELFAHGIDVQNSFQYLDSMVRLYGSCMEENRESMVMELGMYGPLAPRFFIVEGHVSYRKWERVRYLSWCTRLQIGYSLAVFADQLHRRGFVFCDWSSEQFVLRSDYSMMVVDTNAIAKISNDSLYSTTCGRSKLSKNKRRHSSSHYPPEQSEEVPMNLQYDTFKMAVSILKYLLVTNQPPKFHQHMLDSLVKACTQYEPERRPTAAELQRTLGSWMSSFCQSSN